jgi:hypothetical protein
VYIGHLFLAQAANYFDDIEPHQSSVYSKGIAKLADQAPDIAGNVALRVSGAWTADRLPKAF